MQAYFFFFSFLLVPSSLHVQFNANSPHLIEKLWNVVNNASESRRAIANKNVA